MDSETFTNLVQKMREEQDELLRQKGADYTRHDPDRLANFKRLAKDLAIPPLTVWAVYAGKHWDAIMAYIKSGKAESEDIRTRLIDLQNYLYLGQAILEDEKEWKGYYMTDANDPLKGLVEIKQKGEYSKENSIKEQCKPFWEGDSKPPKSSNRPSSPDSKTPLDRMLEER